MSPKLIDTENMVSVSGILVAAVDIRGHLGTRKLTQEELTRVEADARDEERLKVGKAEDDARRSRCADCAVSAVGAVSEWFHCQNFIWRSIYMTMLTMPICCLWIFQIFCDILYHFLKISNVRYAASCQRCCSDGRTMVQGDGPRGGGGGVQRPRSLRARNGAEAEGHGAKAPPKHPRMVLKIITYL